MQVARLLQSGQPLMLLLHVYSVPRVFLDEGKWVKKAQEVKEPSEEIANECSMLLLGGERSKLAPSFSSAKEEEREKM